MKTPRFLLGAAFLFWGWRTDFLIFGVIMAILSEAAHFIKTRWDISPRDFYRIANLCVLIFGGMFLYRFFGMESYRLGQENVSMARWIPVGFFPLLLAQAYSIIQGIDMGAIFYIKRQQEIKRHFANRETFDISYPMLLLTLISTSASNIQSPVFFIGLVILGVWALWMIRPHRQNPVVWWLMIVITVSTGWYLQHTIRQTHRHLERNYMTWFTQRRLQPRNPLINSTAMGRIGKMKDTGHILLRVKSTRPLPEPILLHEASYTVFNHEKWHAAPARFESIAPELGDISWRFSASTATTDTLAVLKYLAKGKGVLPLPDNTIVVDSLLVGLLEKNLLGTVQVDEGPTFVDFEIYYRGPATIPADTTRFDLDLPVTERETIQAIARELGLLDQQNPTGAIMSVRRFFKDFSYTLTQTEIEPGRTPLNHFLTRSKAGHCEFFATATVLLLRAANIPARYATGLVVSEYSELESAYIVRTRHAHAWCLAYVNGNWITVDTTPVNWLNDEEKNASKWEAWTDRWHYFKLQFDKWRMSDEDRNMDVWLILTAIILGGFIFFRIFRRNSRSVVLTETVFQPPLPTIDSPFYRIEKRFSRSGLERHEAETYYEWLNRIRPSLPSDMPLLELPILIAQHYRLRFYPESADDTFVEKYDREVEHWLNSIQPFFRD